MGNQSDAVDAIEEIAQEVAQDSEVSPDTSGEMSVTDLSGQIVQLGIDEDTIHTQDQKQ